MKEVFAVRDLRSGLDHMHGDLPKVTPALNEDLEHALLVEGMMILINHGFGTLSRINCPPQTHAPSSLRDVIRRHKLLESDNRCRTNQS